MGEVVEIGPGCEAQGGRPGGGVLLHRLRPVLVLPARAVVAVRQRQPQPGDDRGRCGVTPPAASTATPRHGRLRGQSRRIHPGAVRGPRRLRRPGRASTTSGRCSPPTRRPPAGWARTWRRQPRRHGRGVGRRRGRARWPRARPCSWAPSGSSSSTGIAEAARSRSGTHIGAETIDYTSVDVAAELREMTGGRGPDVCIEAVGMEAHSRARSTSTTRSSSSCGCRPTGRRRCGEAIYACRKGGTVFTSASSAASWTSSPSAR